jgi:cyclohexa-1,5-dienecarbonyl-CoA hydratase
LSSERFLRLERSGGGRLASLEIHLPPVNVLRVGDLEALVGRVREARGADVLVLSGLPKAFSAGVDVADHAPEPQAIERMLVAMRDVLGSLVGAPAVTIAAVNGACLGGGAEIAAACDLVYVAEDARIGFPEIRLACFPPGAAVLLPCRLGDARSAEWILTGETFSGREAARVGFATRAFPAEKLAREVERCAAELLARSPQALAAARDLLRRGRSEALAHALPDAEQAYRKLAGSEDLARAVREFGRSPQSTVGSRQEKGDVDS